MTSCAPKHATKGSSDATSTRYHIPVGMYKSFDACFAHFDLGSTPDGLLHVLGGPLAAGPGLPHLGRRAVHGLEGRCRTRPGAGRLAWGDHRHPARRRQLELLVRGGRGGARALPQGSHLHERHPVRVREHQPCVRARAGPVGPPRLAVPRRRARRRAADGGHPGSRLQVHAPGAPGRGGPIPGGQGRARTDGGPRGDGHVGHRRPVCAPTALRAWPDRGQPLLLHGRREPGGRPGAWLLDRGRPGGVGAEQRVAGALLHVPSAVSAIWGPFIGPLIAVLTFVCSVGNIPLAVVLWNGGISFGGVISFIFADLIILPILDIYRRYYGGRMSLYLLATSYGAMVLAGLVVGGAFQLL